MVNILFLGYYDRYNAGDEIYKTAFGRVFDNCDLTFKCPDDIGIIPPETDIIIVGGGDVINDYFMSKIEKLIKTFVGRVYAISVGIPFSCASKYLYMFDHVFTRSVNDAASAISKIGNKNVGVIKDMAFSIPIVPSRKREEFKTYGVCMAHPYFSRNPNKDMLIDQFINAIQICHETNQDVLFDFIPFNLDINNKNENDIIISNEVMMRLLKLNIPCKLSVFENPLDILNHINTNVDATICMRFHSVVFSLMTATRPIVIYTTSKIDNLLVDMDYDTRFVIKMPVDSAYKPNDLDGSFLGKILIMGMYDNMIDSPKISPTIFEEVKKTVLVDKKQSNVLVHSYLNSFDDTAVTVKNNLMRYLDKPDISLTKQGVFELSNNKTYEDVARLICFTITKQINHAGVWGLTQNLQRPDFVLIDTIQYLWGLQKQKFNTPVYAPEINVPRKTIYNLDYVFENNFSQYHRSGWTYALGGLVNFDASHLLRESNILIDTYLDRTFHWGKDIMKFLNLIPYKNPWYGFIHHTFDTTHSTFNCNILLKTPEFIESLKSCKGLIVLSAYLANELRQRLPDVPVFVVYHPTESVKNSFSMNKFFRNHTKKIVQIGAWLRDPFAIYELPLPRPNATYIHKAVLKGKDMNNYFPPHDIIKKLECSLEQKECDETQEDPICRVSRDSCSINKFSKGLINYVENSINSVELINKLSNESYDELLSCNLVFLKLVDCSAVNTVIECIIRNTPLIVNKHPAVIELLGENYPGFYSSMYEAVSIVQCYEKIYAIHNYLRRLNKERFSLNTFVSNVSDIVVTGQQPVLLPLFSDFQSRYGILKRFLPR